MDKDLLILTVKEELFDRGYSSRQFTLRTGPTNLTIFHKGFKVYSEKYEKFDLKNFIDLLELV